MAESDELEERRREHEKWLSGPAFGPRDFIAKRWLVRMVDLDAELAAARSKSTPGNLSDMMARLLERARDYLRVRMQGGDEIWWYEYFPGPLMGDAGYAIVRGGAPVCGYPMIKS